ncbi:MAG TPA: bile acid:sodium symporter [Vicinamibacteria bacterium]|nr:bile acid:sodium symporter [Vicinamibacteria bacterium]
MSPECNPSPAGGDGGGYTPAPVLKVLVEVGVPAATFLLMTLVGLELTAADFRRVALYPGTVVAATLGQVLVLPLLVSGLIVAMGPPPAIAAGMILMAACPPAILSSVYISLAGADTALGVTLTAVFDVLSVVSLPLVLAGGLSWQAIHPSGIRPPILIMMGQLLFLLLLPTGVGMLWRRRFPEAVKRHRPFLQGVSLGGLIALVGGFLWSQVRFLAGAFWDTAAAAGLFTGLALLSGWAVARICGVGRGARLAVAFVFASRSVAVAIVVAVTLLKRPEFLLFATVFFLTHTALMLVAVAVVRWNSSRAARAPLPNQELSP